MTSSTSRVDVSEFGELPPIANFRSVLLDLDGTVYLDGDPLPSAQEFITDCVEAGCLVSYITNLSLFPKAHCLDALERMGLATTPRHVLTAVDVMMTTLDGRVPGRRIGVLAAEHVRTRLQIAGYRVTDLNAGPPEGPLDALVVGQVPELHPEAPAHVRGRSTPGSRSSPPAPMGRCRPAWLGCCRPGRCWPPSPAVPTRRWRWSTAASRRRSSPPPSTS